MNDVFRILKSSPFLLNAIPEDRRWGVIHQAVWWNNEEIMKKLLDHSTCDSRLLTKETTSEVGDTSAWTAYDVAVKYGYTDIAKLLEKHSNKLTTEEEIEELPTFHYQNSDIQLKGLGLLRVTLASYRHTFCPFTISGNKSLSTILGEIFDFVDSGDNWAAVKDKVCDSLYTVCKPAVKVLRGVKTKQKFYEKIVNVYTNEDTQLYMYLNTALRRQEERNYRPTAKDLGLGPYVLMFHLLLMYWSPLSPEEGTTYRTMLVNVSDSRRYQKGTQFVWLSFVSSSVDKAKAEPFPTCVASGQHKLFFIINNSAASSIQPRNIEAYAQYVEKERVYPAGTEFLVTDRLENDEETTIHLKLIDRQLAFAQKPK